VPEYLLRFVAWIVSHGMYRLRVRGDSAIPAADAAIVAANHVSFVDAVLLMAVSPRPIRFMMDHRIFRAPALGAVFRLAGAIPVAPRQEDPVAYESAFVAARKVLAEGDLLGIFPEGGITRDGTLQPLRSGILKILEANPVPVVPVALTNLWGSFFSRIDGEAMKRPFRRGMFSRVGVEVGEAMPADTVTLAVLQARLSGLFARGQSTNGRSAIDSPSAVQPAADPPAATPPLSVPPGNHAATSVPQRECDLQRGR
jgi:1-acyl-sn-glycerol-3-phosphate acyltransferase